jgi:hypothetical protein
MKTVLKLILHNKRGRGNVRYRISVILVLTKLIRESATFVLMVLNVILTLYKHLTFNAERLIKASRSEPFKN